MICKQIMNSRFFLPPEKGGCQETGSPGNYYEKVI